MRKSSSSYFSVSQGKPRPVATWFKDGEPIDPKMVNVRSTNVDTILFIREAEREHSGTYELVLKIENMEDRASLVIRIVGTVVSFILQPGRSASTLSLPASAFQREHLTRYSIQINPDLLRR